MRNVRTTFVWIAGFLLPYLAIGQWDIEFPDATRNSYFHLANPPDSATWIALGQDLLLIDTNTLQPVVQPTFDLPYSFENLLVTFPAPQPHSDMVFTSADTGFIAIFDKIMKTTNGGASWEVVKQLEPNNSTYPLSAFFTNLNFPTPQVGYAVGTFDKIFKTVDGGENWEELQWSTSSAPYRRLSEVVFRNELEGYVVGYEVDDILLNIGVYRAFLLKTEDGGQQWEEIQVLPGIGESDHHYGKLQPVNDTTLYLSLTNRNYVFPGDLLLRSTDSGDSWETIPTGTDSTAGPLIRDMYWFSEDEGLLLGSPSGLQLAKQVYRTENGGASWEVVELPVWPALTFDQLYAQKISFKGDRGLIVGTGGSLLYSNDRGESWQSLVQGFPNLNDIYMTSPDQGIAVGNGGYILEKQGADWKVTPHPEDTLTYAQDLTKVKGNGQGKLVVLNRIGESFTRLPGETEWVAIMGRVGDTVVLDVALRGQEEYLLALLFGLELTLLHRENPGAEWGSATIKQVPIDFQAGRLQVMPSGQIYAAYNDQLFASSDLEIGWDTLLTLAQSNFQDRFYFFNDQTGWMIGEETIWRTVDGGVNWEQGTLLNSSNLGGFTVLQHITAFDSAHAVAFAQLYPDSGNVARDLYYYTQDGGQNWELMEIPFQQESWFFGITGSDVVDGSLYVPYTNGVIFRLDEDIVSPIEDPVEGQDLWVYPNPARDEVRIHHPFPYVHARLLNLNGQVIREYTAIEPDRPFHLQLEVPGIYWLQVFRSDFQTTLKVLVQGRKGR